MKMLLIAPYLRYKKIQHAYLSFVAFFSVFCWENLNKIRNGVELQDFMFAQMPFFSNIIITLFNSLVD